MRFPSEPAPYLFFWGYEIPKMFSLKNVRYGTPHALYLPRLVCFLNKFIQEKGQARVVICYALIRSRCIAVAWTGERPRKWRIASRGNIATPRLTSCSIAKCKSFLIHAVIKFSRAIAQDTTGKTLCVARNNSNYYRHLLFVFASVRLPLRRRWLVRIRLLLLALQRQTPSFRLRKSSLQWRSIPDTSTCSPDCPQTVANGTDCGLLWGSCPRQRFRGLCHDMCTSQVRPWRPCSPTTARQMCPPDSSRSPRAPASASRDTVRVSGHIPATG